MKENRVIHDSIASYAQFHNAFLLFSAVMRFALSPLPGRFRFAAQSNGSQFTSSKNLISSFHGAILTNFQNAELLLIFFTNRALAAFLSVRIFKKWAQKNRKPFLDFLFRCATCCKWRLFNFM